jgi:hypothetical protein
MSVLRRLSAAVALAAALLAFVVGPAAAKVSYFSIDVMPPAPTAGEPVTVVVRLWNDPAHTLPADWALPDEVMDEMVAFQSEDAEVRVALTQFEDGSYRGTVTLPAGSWTMVPFPDGVGLGEPIPGFQTPIAVTVSAPSPWFTPLALAATLAGAGAIAAVFGRRRQRSPRAQEARQPA